MRCGACCYSEGAHHVRVTGDDWSRLGEDADRLAHFLGNQAFMKMDADAHRCAALVVTRGRFVCSIYETRPATCRELARLSPACEGELVTKRRLTLLP